MSTQRITPGDRPLTQTPSPADKEHLTEAEIRAELERRGVSLPPAGFIPAEITDEVSEIQWNGPRHDTETWRVTSQWTDLEGVGYFIDHNNDEPWTPGEVEELPVALAGIKHAINLAAALKFVQENPNLLTGKSSVTDLCVAAEAAGVSWAAMAEAWSTHRDLAKGGTK